MDCLGNRDLLNLPKMAFLASRTIPVDMVLKCYDWAAGKHEGCVISGFSSKLEKDVLHFLVKAKCPVILVLARRMYKVLPEELQAPLEQGRLLIISTFDSPRQSHVTAQIRNEYVCKLADRILFVGVDEKSSLFELKSNYKSKTTSIIAEGKKTIL